MTRIKRVSTDLIRFNPLLSVSSALPLFKYGSVPIIKNLPKPCLLNQILSNTKERLSLSKQPLLLIYDYDR